MVADYSRVVQGDDIEARLAILGIRQQERLAQRRAELLHLPYVNLSAFPVDTEALALISKQEAEATHAVLFYKKGRDVRIGVVNPALPGVALLLETTHKKVSVSPQMFIISNYSLGVALSRYPAQVLQQQPRDEMNVGAEKLSVFEQTVADLQALGKHIMTLPPSEILSTIVAGAVKLTASDIHIEPRVDHAWLRYRIDGVLHDITAFDLEGWKQILSRVKVLSKLKLNVRDAPQEGSFVLRVGDTAFDVRVSILPGGTGENIVLRLFGRRAEPLRLTDLGMKKHDYQLVFEELRRNTGMILAAGPTGSGKTTTIVACLTEVNRPELKVITIEDPIEYRLSGIEQTQVDVGAGYTFGIGLRSILRQDPDVIMIGEMRDTETAEVAMHAALTGHLVFSTVHSNDAASAIPRLVDMNMKPYILAPALNVVIAQRLVRIVCTHCAQRYTPNERVREHMRLVLQGVRHDVFDPAALDNPKLQFLRAQGCSQCGGTGYRGRTGLFEIFAVRDELEELILQAADSNRIRRAAFKQGMTTLAQDGYLKVYEQVTTIEEIERVSSE